ncbi:hypothetical protein IAQ61_007261 [Plenodomus lingam]|uniref:uncharacterized protein n=1 Tax=Leptosphaeria maculans TaxID=5022 RepID=UPI00333215C9|nr:hypothetical protein IAQ61_007261 [Plenodomus lingam]
MHARDGACSCAHANVICPMHNAAAAVVVVVAAAAAAAAANTTAWLETAVEGAWGENGQNKCRYNTDKKEEEMGRTSAGTIQTRRKRKWAEQVPVQYRQEGRGNGQNKCRYNTDKKEEEMGRTKCRYNTDKKERERVAKSKRRDERGCA